MLKTMLTYIFIAIVVLIGIFLGLVLTRPDEFRITRTTTMNAPASAIFPQVNDLHNWTAWSPWAKRDPNMKATFEGSSAGPGAVYSWAGNKEVGEGRMTIVENRPNELVRIKLEFFKPFAATNLVDFTFLPKGSQTEVSWSMYGRNSFMGKVMSLLMDMDKMCGTDFEKGLADMRAIVEGSHQTAAQ